MVPKLTLQHIYIYISVLFVDNLPFPIVPPGHSTLKCEKKKKNEKEKEKKKRQQLLPLLAIAFACYRIGFGPPARNRKKLEKHRFRPPEALPRRKRKTIATKTGKMAQNLGFGAMFLFFGNLILFSRGGPREAETYVFPIFFLYRGGGPKPIL